MFGKRGNETSPRAAAAPSVAPTTRTPPPAVLMEPVVEQGRQTAASPQAAPRRRPQRTEEYYDTKSQVFSALIDTIDLSQLSKLDSDSRRTNVYNLPAGVTPAMTDKWSRVNRLPMTGVWPFGPYVLTTPGNK